MSAVQLRLYCLPPAGAGAAAFRSWQPRLPADVRVCAVRLPGREARLDEAPITAMDELSAAVAASVDTTTPGGYAVLGHSFGALAAFEVVRRLRRTGAPPPSLLVVLAAPAPQLPLAGHQDVDEITFLRRMGGTAENVLAHRRLMRLVLPALRADVGICRAYAYAEERPLDIPILAMAGSRDPLVPVDAVTQWADQTTGGFRFEVLDDDHFFPGRGDRFFETLAEACEAACLHPSHRRLAAPLAELPDTERVDVSRPAHTDSGTGETRTRS